MAGIQLGLKSSEYSDINYIFIESITRVLVNLYYSSPGNEIFVTNSVVLKPCEFFEYLQLFRQLEGSYFYFSNWSEKYVASTSLISFTANFAIFTFGIRQIFGLFQIKICVPLVGDTINLHYVLDMIFYMDQQITCIGKPGEGSTEVFEDFNKWLNTYNN